MAPGLEANSTSAHTPQSTSSEEDWILGSPGKFWTQILERYLRFIVSQGEFEAPTTTGAEGNRWTPQGPASVHIRANHLQCPLPAACLQVPQDSRKNGGEGGHFSSEVGCIGEEEDQQWLDDADPLGEACSQGQEEGKD